MKAEHRKELQTNTLADNLGKFVERAKHGPSRNTVIVLTLLVLAVGLFFTWRYFARRSEVASAQRWVDWHQLSTGDRMPEIYRELAAKEEMLPQRQRREQAQLMLLESFAAEHKGTVQGQVARFQEARLALAQGLSGLGAEATRDRSLELIKKAEGLYSELIKETGDTPLLHQEAVLNAAIALETLGSLDRSKELYEQLVREHPRSTGGKLAAEALKRREAHQDQLKAITSALSTPVAGTGGGGQ